MSKLPRHNTSITEFRSFVREVLEQEAVGQKRNIVLLGLDGIPYTIASDRWKKADLTQLRSVFPTTSSTGWLSSLTGASVEEHGIPGVAFKPDGDANVINVFSYKGALRRTAKGNVFSDAAEHGYTPLAVVGDLEPLDCTWRDVLLEGSQRVTGYRFYTASEPLTPGALGHVLRDAIDDATDTDPSPCLVWCFVDCDQRIHRMGYDAKLLQFLDHVEAIASELSQNGTIVVAHSDHGLTLTAHDDTIASVIDEATLTYDCSLGGAGRTRWLYPPPEARDSLLRHMRQRLPPSVLVCGANELLPERSVERSRFGDIMLIAHGERFITGDGYRYDHGSLTETEMAVPLARWHA